MIQYLDLVREVLENGEEKDDRTGVGTYSLFGAQLRFDLRKGFPILTTKKVNFNAVVRELLWFLSGSTDISQLGKSKGLWEPWANEHGVTPLIYPAQWRKYEGVDGYGKICQIDQISRALHTLKTDPNSRRIVVSAWNVSQIYYMALPPCHALFQLYVSNNGELDLQLYQRSADLAIGVPFNVSSYALLLSMMAKECGYTPRYFIHTFGDVHIYKNHVEGLQKQLLRTTHIRPTLRLADKRVLDFTFDDIKLEGYIHEPFIKFEVAV